MHKKILFVVHVSLLAASCNNLTTYDVLPDYNDTWVNNEIITTQLDQSTTQPEQTANTSEQATTTNPVLEDTDATTLYC